MQALALGSMPYPKNDVYIARLSLFVVCILALILLLTTSGCAGNPSRTRPKGFPFPKTLRPQIRVYPLEKVRCLGSGLGGCSAWNLR